MSHAAPQDDPFAQTGSAHIPHSELFEHHYPAHLKTLQQRLQDQLGSAEHDTLVLTAGAPSNHLFDDQPTSFRANPHLRQWLPIDECAEAALLLEPGQLPTLFFLQPSDYWHLPPSVPDWAQKHLDVQTFADTQSLQQALATKLQGRNGVAMVGPEAEHSRYPSASSNPTELLAVLDFDRGQKTRFELLCMQLATRRAVAGHLAAEAQFSAGLQGSGASEFDIHGAYLQASLQTEQDLPYNNIVALNEHAAVLHYQHQERVPPAPMRSLLIDAGARAHGYASDITRTYSDGSGAFVDLLAALDQAQQALIATIKPGMNYLDLHIDMHRRIATLLCDCELLRCDPEQAFSQGLTETFLPHGLGHLIGLQTHDVAGQADRTGRPVPPPPEYGALRLTRDIEEHQVFTIEPGIYFIPMLLQPLMGGPHKHLLNESLLAELTSYGGIRIEDNIVVTANGCHNLTRESFAEQGARA